MNQINKSKKQARYNDDEESEDIDDLGEENSFEGENKIFEMKSAIHSLQIEKNRLALQHQSSMASLETKNQQLTTQYNSLRRENGKLLATIKKLEDENSQMKKNSDVYRLQMENSNRRTADFHRSMEDNALSIGDPSDLINELLSKDKKIQELNKKLQNLSVQQASKTISIPGQRQRHELQIKNLKNTIEDLKKKQVVYKRQYEGMIQTKDQIIRRMSTQNEDYSKKVIESKEQIIIQLKKDADELQKQINASRQEINSLKEKLLAAERENMKTRADFKRKEETILSQFENEKEDLTKGLNEKLKKHLKAKQQKMSKNEQAFFELENQLMMSKQQNVKLKAQVTSLKNFNQYLQVTNKEYEESKKKLQLSLYDKQKQAGQLKQNYFIEVSEITKTLNKERQIHNQKLQSLSQQLLHQTSLIQKYEQSNKNKSLNANENIERQFEKVAKQRQNLEADLVALQKRYEEKSQKLLNAEKRIRKEYEERINGLQRELISSRENKMNEDVNKRDPIASDKSPFFNEKELQKIVDISELRKIQIEDKQRQIKRAFQDKMRTERENQELKASIVQLERKIKQKVEDHKNLQISYQDLSEKYRKGVKELQIKIEQMGQQITEERKRAQRRKLQATENEESLAEQIKKYKNKIRELEGEVSVYKNRKISEAEETDLRLQRLTHEMQYSNKEKQEAIKSQQRRIKSKQLALEEANAKLQQYIDQLQENISILSTKLNAFENKQRKIDLSTEQQLREVKMEYSQSLSQLNMVLQKYKKLEEVHRETLAEYDGLKDERENLNIKYLQVYKERNKAVDDLNSAYDQINKLNLVLMSKQEQISKNNHSLNYPQYNPRPKYNQMPEPTRDQTNTSLAYNRNPNSKLYERNQVLYAMQTANKFPRYS